jgi:hypothetical protein
MNITVYPDNEKVCLFWHSWHVIVEAAFYSYSECLDCKARRYLGSSSDKPDALWLSGKKLTADMLVENFRR